MGRFGDLLPGGFHPRATSPLCTSRAASLLGPLGLLVLINAAHICAPVTIGRHGCSVNQVSMVDSLIRSLLHRADYGEGAFRSPGIEFASGADRRRRRIRVGHSRVLDRPERQKRPPPRARLPWFHQLPGLSDSPIRTIAFAPIRWVDSGRYRAEVRWWALFERPPHPRCAESPEWVRA